MLKFLLVVIVFAVATYLAVRVIQQRGLMPDKPALAEAPSRRRKIGRPDDDQDFLRDLDRKRLNPEDPRRASGSATLGLDRDAPARRTSAGCSS